VGDVTYLRRATLRGPTSQRRPGHRETLTDGTDQPTVTTTKEVHILQAKHGRLLVSQSLTSTIRYLTLLLLGWLKMNGNQVPDEVYECLDFQVRPNQCTVSFRFWMEMGVSKKDSSFYVAFSTKSESFASGT
jgi:hypothetical protein